MWDDGDMNFSIVLICKNEQNTLPRLFSSLQEFMKRGGEVIVLDTGSTDGTAHMALGYGAQVTYGRNEFLRTITAKEADSINTMFVVGDEPLIVKEGDKLFDFAAARNYASSLAKNDMICSLDADEQYTAFNIDRIEQMISEGYEQFEYQFVYAHKQDGTPAIQFVQSKFFDRRKARWEGIVHEVLVGDTKKLLLHESIVKLEHFQEQGKEHRGNYLVGLALDCWEHWDKDRQSHYLARELMWTGRPRSALQEFQRHIKMNGWPAERAQSMTFMGDCYGKLGMPQEQVEWYNNAFYLDSNRREPLIKLALFYQFNGNKKACAVYAAGALELPWTDYYANDRSHYDTVPLQLLAWAHSHVERGLPTISVILPTLGRPEGLQRCIDSIKALNYPQELIDIRIIDGEGTVPEKVNKGVANTQGEYIVYAANDMEFRPDDLKIAVELSLKTGKGLVAFNTGVRNPEGYICEHFLLRRNMVPRLGGEVFCSRMKHVGVDDLLWKKCEKLGEAILAEDTRTIHRHFTRGVETDAVYEKGWASAEDDRRILAEELAALFVP